MALYVVMSLFTVGEGFVVALAARQELPGRALRRRRASRAPRRWFVLRRVTLPLMSPTLAAARLPRPDARAAAPRSPRVYLITDGGPDRATLFLPVLVYDYAFEQLRYGYAAAISLVLFAATAAVVLLAHRVLRRRWFGLIG